MQYFLDTEFIENGQTIDLISIGIACEDGREYYAVNAECKIQFASPWVWENVLNPMGIYSGDDWVANPGDPSMPPILRGTLLARKNLNSIKSELMSFLLGDVELWADYGAHDFVLFGQIMSRGDRNTHNPMSDCYPSNLPWHYNELRQEAKRLRADLSKISRENEHNALADARWGMKALHLLQEP